MNIITSIYIPHMETHYSAEYIADVLDRSGIAKISKVAFELKNKYKRAWVDIKSWYDTESAFNFLKRLRNPSSEARFIHSNEQWWSVEINKFPHKTDSSLVKSQLIIFQELKYNNSGNDDDLTCDSTIDDDLTCHSTNDSIDTELTCGWEIDDINDDESQKTDYFEVYCREIDESRECWL